jgi:hypothetical protein
MSIPSHQPPLHNSYENGTTHGAAMLNMCLYYHYSKVDEEQLGANEGRFLLFTSAMFFSADNITFDLKLNCLSPLAFLFIYTYKLLINLILIFSSLYIHKENCTPVESNK